MASIQRERAGFAHIAAEHPSERARSGADARAVLPVCVARNDGEGLVIATATIRSVLVWITTGPPIRL